MGAGIAPSEAIGFERLRIHRETCKWAIRDRELAEEQIGPCCEPSCSAKNCRGGHA